MRAPSGGPGQMLGTVSPGGYLTPYVRCTWCLRYICLALRILGLLVQGLGATESGRTGKPLRVAKGNVVPDD